MNTVPPCQEMLRKAIEFCSNPNDRPFITEEWCTPRSIKQWLVVIGESFVCQVNYFNFTNHW